jgi:3-hydroxyacyl-CoA dehydrogenase
MAKPIRNVAIMSTGVIGASWAALYLAHGFKLTATDSAPNAEVKLHRNICAAWKDLTAIGPSPNASREHPQFTPDVKKALSNAGFVQENRPERQEFKIKPFAEMEDATPRDSIIAYSSSGLTRSIIQSGCKRPKRSSGAKQALSA